MLWKGTILALIGQCSILAASAVVHKRITNGPEAQLGEFPYMDQTAGGFTVDVLSRKTHPNYQKGVVDGVYKANDIAILKLKQRIRESDTIAYAKLPTDGSDPGPNSTAIAVGWGSTKDVGDAPSVVLRKVPLSTSLREVCRKLDPDVGSRDTVLCVSGADGQGICKNDSGGPLVDEKTRAIIGVTSWSIHPPGYVFGEVEECGHAPALFTRVSGYIPFILENLGETGQTEDATPEDPKKVEQEARDKRLRAFCRADFRDDALCMLSARRCTGQVKKDASMDEFLGCVDRMQICTEQGMDTDECRAKVKKCAEAGQLALGDMDGLAKCTKESP